MTIERRADLVLPAVLGDLAGNASPDYLDDVLAATAHVRQRRASASIQRWLPILDTTGASVLGPRLPWRALAVALVIIALLVASLALLAGAASRKLAPPFGLAATGLVAFVSGDDLVATMPDGTGRRALVTGDGVQWGLIWSHRGDRFAYWSATRTTDDPASLWVADRDGSNQQVVSGDPVPGVADLLPTCELVAGRPAARLRGCRRPLCRQRRRLGPALDRRPNAPAGHSRLVARRLIDRLHRPAAGRPLLADVHLGDHA